MHFTFKAPSDPYIQQGDLIRKSDRLCELLERVHPHYLRPDYSHFVVLTQSCDLVRRSDGTGQAQCKARYITVAAVRPLDLVIKREIGKHQSALEVKAEICSKAKRDLVRMFLERLLNNNQDDYFYLQAEPAAGVPDNLCAFLRLSIALRAYEHYDLLLESRCLSLDPMFQAKLGWLVGSMFSRVGTDDWAPDHYSEDDFRTMIAGLIDSACEWVDEPQLREARRTLKDEFQNLEKDALRQRIQSLKIEPKIDRIAERAVAILVDAGMLPDGVDPDKARLRLRNDPSLASLAK